MGVGRHRKIDEMYGNSDTPTKTQSEEAFGQHVRRDGRRLQMDHRRDRPGRGRLRCSASPRTRWRWPSASGPPRSPCSRPSASASRWSMGADPGRIDPHRLASAGLIGAIGMQGLLRRRRPLEIHRGDDAVLLRQRGPRPSPAWSVSLGDRRLQRALPRHHGLEALGRQRPEEGGLNPDGAAQVQRPGTSGSAGSTR